MENSDAGPVSSPDTMRFYVGRAEEVYGPYPRPEIEQLHSEGRLIDTDFVWNEGAQTWTPLPEFLKGPEARVAETADVSTGIKPQDGPLYPCERHATKAATSHCAACNKLLCARCLLLKSGVFFCESCAASVRDRTSDHVQDRLQKSLGIFYDQPFYAVIVILLLAVFFMPAHGKAGVKRVEGIDTAEANRLWKQAQDALTVANAWTDNNQPERAGRWFRLALESAEKVADDPSISNLIREQAIMFQMRISLDIEDYDLLNRLLENIHAKLERIMRQGDLMFFEGCNAYLNEKNIAKAIERFETLVDPDERPGASIDLLIDVMSKPVRGSTENMQRLLAESFSEIEATYRLAVCYEMDGKIDKARDMYYRVYKSEASVADTRWRRLAAKKVESLGATE